MIHTSGAALALAVFLLCQDTVVGAAQGAPASPPESAVVVMLGTGTPDLQRF